jgi:hypothetical protein
MLYAVENLSRRTRVHYHICVKGHLDSSWQHWFAPLQIRNEAAGTTVLSGSLPDQAALYGLLLKIDRLGLTCSRSKAAKHCINREMLWRKRRDASNELKGE